MNGRAFKSVKEFGAVGDGYSYDGKALQAAVDAVSKAGGGEVVLPPGAYVSGSLFLRDGVVLRLEEGASLVGSSDVRDYPIVEGRWEGATRRMHASLVHAQSVRNSGITGKGTIDGRGEKWWELHRAKSLLFPRPRLIAFEDCEDIVLSDFRAKDSPSWTVNPVRSHNVVISRLVITNPPDSPNTDGIDPDSCENVEISDCFVSVGDDCIAIKAGSENESAGKRASCDRIRISGCVLERGHGGVVVGSEMSGGIRDVVVTDCVFRGTDRGIRMKSRRGRGGLVEDFHASGIKMYDVDCPFAINLRYHCGARGDPEVADLASRPFGPRTPVFRRLSFEYIEARNSGLAAAWIDGLAESPVEDVLFSNITIEMGGGGLPRPAEMSDWAPPLARAGFYAFDVRRLRLDTLHISGYAGPAYVIDACEDFVHSNCEPEPPLCRTPRSSLRVS